MTGASSRIVKVFHTAEELAAALVRAGFVDPAVSTTGRFFVTGSATVPA